MRARLIVDAICAETEQTVRVSTLPDDMLVLLQDYFGAAGKRVPLALPVRQIPIEAFPDVEFPDEESDDRGGVRHAEKMVGVKLPPVIVGDGQLLDGRHRVWSARRQGLPWVMAIDLTGMGVTNFQFPIGKMDPPE